MLLADRDKIGSVVSNLLSNAVKYSMKDQTVIVQSQVCDSTFTVSVSDRGMGISPEDRSRIFERFYRVQNDYSRHIAGFGIGL